jgi:hypothetical protein
MVTEAALPSGNVLPKAGQEEITVAGETTPPKDQEVRWEVVAVANGLAEAAIIRGRLEAEGIRAQVHQEPAGVAIGLTLGLLGQAKVLVPEPMVENALDILNQPAQGFELDDVEGSID